MTQQTEPTRDPYRLTSDQQVLFNRAVWIVIGIFIGGFLFSDTEGYVTNIFTEIAGIIITFSVLETWARRRDKKQQLLRQVCSPVTVIRDQAIYEIRDQEWLTGENGLLKEADLSGARLQKAALSKANLQGARLVYVKLQKAEMWKANLQEANLEVVNLQGAKLDEVNLQKAKMYSVNLQEANLYKADLQGANLREVDLRGANLKDANLRGVVGLETCTFDEKTLLPDATWIWNKADEQYTPESYWSETVMTRYTNPDRTDFWQPDRAKGSTK